MTFAPTVPNVELIKLRVTSAEPVLLTMPLIVLFVSVTVTGVFVLCVKLPLIVTPVMPAGVAWSTFAVIVLPERTAPLARVTVPVVVMLPVNVDDLIVIVLPDNAKGVDAVASMMTL